jgi:hypothetical protein
MGANQAWSRGSISLTWVLTKALVSQNFMNHSFTHSTILNIYWVSVTPIACAGGIPTAGFFPSGDCHCASTSLIPSCRFMIFQFKWACGQSAMVHTKDKMIESVFLSMTSLRDVHLIWTLWRIHKICLSQVSQCWWDLHKEYPKAFIMLNLNGSICRCGFGSYTLEF